MENAARALEIAAGVLIGVMILALVVYFFSSLSSWPEQQQEAMTVEQLAKFNLEYEVYNKSAMYGVDVISCLNKAKDNNDRYLGDQEKLGFLTEGRNPSEYLINVFVKFKDGNHAKLKESVRVYKMDNGLEKEQFSNYDSQMKIQDVFSKNNINTAVLDISFGSNKITTLVKNANMKSIANQPINLGTANSGNYYSLIDSNNKYSDTSLAKLLKLLELPSGNNMRIILKNTNGDYTKWSTAIWETALYDLKTKRFKCEGEKIKYNSKTGRISEIYFSEIDS